jgi:hypothetical protein
MHWLYPRQYRINGLNCAQCLMDAAVLWSVAVLGVAVIGEAYVYPASGFFLSIGCALIQKWS